MAYRCRTAFFLSVCMLWLLPQMSYAEPVRFSGTRAVGMGGAPRAAATGDLAPLLNPSGMSLARSYTVTSAYQYADPESNHDLHVSAVDSTSAFNLGGGFFYSYHRSSKTIQPALESSNVSSLSEKGHQTGVSLSFPFAEKLFIGVSGKYVRFTAYGEKLETGITYDAGLTLRPISILSVAVVGSNLRDLGNPWTPRTFGGGVALIPLPILLLAFDASMEKVYGDSTRDQATSFMGGGELMLSQAFAVRAGGGKNGLSKTTYFSAGFSTIQAGVGALDFSFSRDVSGKELTTFSVSARLFVPAI